MSPGESASLPFPAQNLSSEGSVSSFNTTIVLGPCGREYEEFNATYLCSIFLIRNTKGSGIAFQISDGFKDALAGMASARDGWKFVVDLYFLKSTAPIFNILKGPKVAQL